MTFSWPEGSGSVSVLGMVRAYDAWVTSPHVSTRTLILIPPSEAKASDGDGPPWTEGTSALAELDGPRRVVLRALGRSHPARKGPTMSAIDRYTGVLYGELDAATLRGTPKRRLHRNVLIASGLFGLVAPTDPIPAYKLKMGARLDPLGKLSTWWRPQLTEVLTPRVQRAVVWDLLPNEHAAALDWSLLNPRLRVTLRFLDRNDRTVSHWNKLLKGSIVRWLAETGTTDPRDLAAFDHPQGYRLDESASTFAGTHHQLVLREAT